MARRLWEIPHRQLGLKPRGPARHGEARPGGARQGKAGRGSARQGEARQGMFTSEQWRAKAEEARTIMTFSFRPARRSEAKPLIGLYSESGCGKTWSALMLARGFVGPAGKIGMIETESGRGEAYADVLPGGYDVLPIRENLSPENYGRALTIAEQAKFDALIIDSASHEWEGAGGVLGM